MNPKTRLAQVFEHNAPWAPLDLESADTKSAIVPPYGLINPRYDRYAPRDGLTFCNIYAWDMSRILGREIPHWANPKKMIPTVPFAKGSIETTANWLHNVWLPHPASGFEKVELKKTQLGLQLDASSILKAHGGWGVCSWHSDRIGGRHGHIAILKLYSGELLCMAEAGINPVLRPIAEWPHLILHPTLWVPKT